MSHVNVILARALQRMIDRAEAEIAEAEKTIQVKGLLLQELRQELAVVSAPPLSAEGNGHLPPGTPSLADRIAKVLEAHSGPMRCVEVAERLKQAGVETKSRRGLLPMVASVMSKRSNRFVQVARGLYKLKEGT